MLKIGQAEVFAIQFIKKHIFSILLPIMLKVTLFYRRIVELSHMPYIVQRYMALEQNLVEQTSLRVLDIKPHCFIIGKVLTIYLIS